MKNGIFVTVDGPNGVGKSSFIDALSEKISSSFPLYLTRESSPTQFGEFVKRYEHHLSGVSYARLIWSDRYFHIENFVLPELKSGKVVISDRYVESSFVLQGFDNVPIDKIWDLNKDFIIPDISIILLAAPILLEERLSQRKYLSNFEKRMTRDQEVYAYREAVNFLSEKGFQFLVYENNTIEDFERNVNEVYDRICSLMR